MTDGVDQRRGAPLRVSVVVVTWQRPEHVDACLEHLGKLRTRPSEVIVVDASADDRTATAVRRYPWARLVRFPGGAGHMTTSRNVGLLHVTGDIVAFLDDDAYVRETWLDGLLDAYRDPSVQAVVGRTCNGGQGEESEGRHQIGRLLPNGELTGNFAADPGMLVDVTHGIGANMSFRSDALALLGGFRDDFAGAEVREDTDIFFRLGALRYRVVFSPWAVVDHIGAKHVTGQRFDRWYLYSARQNHVLLFVRNLGLRSPLLWRWVIGELSGAPGPPHPSRLRRASRVAMGAAAILSGLAVSVSRSGFGPTDPRRKDAVGEGVRRSLSHARRKETRADAIRDGGGAPECPWRTRSSMHIGPEGPSTGH
jgi:GT2 family glycosyltransferase